MYEQEIENKTKGNARGMLICDVQPQWVLVDGTLRQVSDFAGLQFPDGQGKKVFVMI